MFRRSGKARQGPAPARPTVFERYGREARAVVTASEAHAQSDGSDVIAVHHVLLAATSVPSGAAWALATKGLDEAVLRDALDRRCGVPFPGTDGRVRARPVAGAPRVPFSEEAKAVLVHAVTVGRRRGRERVEPGDVATAALEAGAPTVVDALDELGLDLPTLVTALA